MIYYELDYAAEKLRYAVGVTSVITLEPVVSWCSYVVVNQHGCRLGKIDASFDFSNMPPEMHGLVLKYLAACATRLRIDV